MDRPDATWVVYKYGIRFYWVIHYEENLPSIRGNSNLHKTTNRL